MCVDVCMVCVRVGVYGCRRCEVQGKSWHIRDNQAILVKIRAY